MDMLASMSAAAVLMSTVQPGRVLFVRHVVRRIVLPLASERKSCLCSPPRHSLPVTVNGPPGIQCWGHSIAAWRHQKLQHAR